VLPSPDRGMKLLVVETTHLKNMLPKVEKISPGRDKNKKIFELTTTQFQNEPQLLVKNQGISLPPKKNQTPCDLEETYICAMFSPISQKRSFRF